jgi:replicative DNA helicase
VTFDDGVTLPGLAPSPAVIATEIAVLGAMVSSRAAAESATEFVKPGDFYQPAHQLIAEAVEALIGAGNPVSEVAVLQKLTALGTVGNAGGGAKLLALVERRSVDVGHDAQVVAKDGVRRRLLQALTRGQQVAGRHDFDIDEDLDLIRSALEEATARVTGDEAPTIGELVLQRLDELENSSAPHNTVPSPYVDLDSLLSGLRPGQVVVIGARPSVGKSTVALDWARSVAVHARLRVLFFSLEMTGLELTDRLLAAEAKVLLRNLRNHELTEDDWDRIGKIQERVLDAPLVVDDSPHCTLGRIRARLRGMARTDPARLCIVDYLGLMDGPRAESRERQVAELSRGFKLLAKEFGIPLIVLSQLNRESVKRTDKKPTMSDLRDSGAVEQDADIVILLHREDVYEKEHPRAGEMDVIVDKNRNGPQATITVAYQGHYARAVDMAPDPPSPPRGYRAAVPA